MSEGNLVIALILALVIGVLFFLIEFYHERYCFECKGPKIKEKYVSLVAGISLTYFFLKLLPEIFEELIDVANNFLIYSFILIGFSLIHLSEKLILKRVERDSKQKVRNIFIKKEQIKSTEKKTERELIIELQKDDWDKFTLTILAHRFSNLDDQKMDLRETEKEFRKKISLHLSKDLNKVHIISNYAYHIIIGFILFNLLLKDYIASFLFFIFSFLKATISNPSNNHIKFLDMNIHTKIKEGGIYKAIINSSVITGVMMGLIFEIIYPIPLFIIFECLAFISGVILYIIVREIIPEDEKGRPSYFLMGIILFFTIILITESIF